MYIWAVRLASYQIRKIYGLHMRREYQERFPRHSWVSYPDMHHGTCVTHVPWCMPCGFPLSRWRGKRSQHSRRMRNPQFYVSGKKPIQQQSVKIDVTEPESSNAVSLVLPRPVEWNSVWYKQFPFIHNVYHCWSRDHYINLNCLLGID